MLHCSILPVHKTFRRLLAHLRYVVVDEGHAYRFGQPFTCLSNLCPALSRRRQGPRLPVRACLFDFRESQYSCKAKCLTFWRTCAMSSLTRATPTGESWVLKIARATLNMIHVGAPPPTDRQCFGTEAAAWSAGKQLSKTQKIHTAWPCSICLAGPQGRVRLPHRTGHPPPAPRVRTPLQCAPYLRGDFGHRRQPRAARAEPAG